MIVLKKIPYVRLIKKLRKKEIKKMLIKVCMFI